MSNMERLETVRATSTDTDYPSLKPCPFCGDPAEIHETTHFRWVECIGCGVQMTRCLKTGEGPVKRWNRRPD